MTSKALLLLAGLSLAACNAQSSTPTDEAPVASKLTVTGAPEAIKQFIAAERSQASELTFAAPTAAADGRVSITTELPSSYSGDKVVEITRAALNAGLDYSLSGVREAQE